MSGPIACAAARRSSYGSGHFGFDPTQWTASVHPASEPGTLCLGLTAGLGLLIWKKRSGRRAVSHYGAALARFHVANHLDRL